MFKTIEEIIESCKNTGKACWNDHYIEYRRPSLFDQAIKATLYKYAHINSTSPNHRIESGSLEDLAWDLLRYEDGIETIWGCF